MFASIQSHSGSLRRFCRQILIIVLSISLVWFPLPMSKMNEARAAGGLAIPLAVKKLIIVGFALSVFYQAIQSGSSFEEAEALSLKYLADENEKLIKTARDIIGDAFQSVRRVSPVDAHHQSIPRKDTYSALAHPHPIDTYPDWYSEITGSFDAKKIQLLQDVNATPIMEEFNLTITGLMALPKYNVATGGNLSRLYDRYTLERKLKDLLTNEDFAQDVQALTAQYGSKISMHLEKNGMSTKIEKITKIVESSEFLSYLLNLSFFKPENLIHTIAMAASVGVPVTKMISLLIHLHYDFNDTDRSLKEHHFRYVLFDALNFVTSFVVVLQKDFDWDDDYWDDEDDDAGEDWKDDLDKDDYDSERWKAGLDDDAEGWKDDPYRNFDPFELEDDKSSYDDLPESIKDIIDENWKEFEAAQNAADVFNDSDPPVPEEKPFDDLPDEIKKVIKDSWKEFEASQNAASDIIKEQESDIVFDPDEEVYVSWSDLLDSLRRVTDFGWN